jgi:hypothetical protein
MTQWERMPGLATDIAADGIGTAWVIGTNPVSAGFSIHRWNETIQGWDNIEGGGEDLWRQPRLGGQRCWSDPSLGSRQRADPVGTLPGKAIDVGIGMDMDGGSDFVRSSGPIRLMVVSARSSVGLSSRAIGPRAEGRTLRSLQGWCGPSTTETASIALQRHWVGAIAWRGQGHRQ